MSINKGEKFRDPKEECNEFEDSCMDLMVDLVG